jgi:hypothetical protein
MTQVQQLMMIFSGGGIRFSSSSVLPIANGLLHNEVEYLIINNISVAVKLMLLKQITRKVNNGRVRQFWLFLKSETWISLS